MFVTDAQERLEFAVDFLRPCPGVDTVHGGQTPFVCAGEHTQEGERHLVVLGDTHRPLQGPSDNVVYLRNILRAPAA
ncbi:hypothetical protein D3C77_757810 [compost metagenome]